MTLTSLKSSGQSPISADRYVNKEFANGDGLPILSAQFRCCIKSPDVLPTCQYGSSLSIQTAVPSLRSRAHRPCPVLSIQSRLDDGRQPRI